MVSRFRDEETVTTRIRVEGAGRARRDIEGVNRSLGGLERASRGTLLPMLGGGLLAGIFGASLFSLALGSAEAQGAMAGLGYAIETLASPLLGLLQPATDTLNQFINWNPVLAQIVAGTTLAALTFNIWWGAIIRVATVLWGLFRVGALLTSYGLFATIGVGLLNIGKALKGLAVTSALPFLVRFSGLLTRMGARLILATPLLHVLRGALLGVAGALGITTGAALWWVVLIIAVAAGLYLLFTRSGIARRGMIALANSIADGLNNILRTTISLINLVIRGLNLLSPFRDIPFVPTPQIPHVPNIPSLDDFEGGFGDLRPHEQGILDFFKGLFGSITGQGIINPPIGGAVNNFYLDPNNTAAIAQQQIGDPTSYLKFRENQL